MVYDGVKKNKEHQTKGGKEMKQLKRDIEIGEKRLKNLEESRAHFARAYKKTGEELYKDLAQDETRQIDELRKALTEAYLKLK